jgi:hypothetical protein
VKPPKKEGKPFALKRTETMVSDNEVYSPREIALAAGVSEQQVVEAIARGGGDRLSYVRHADAVRIGRALAKTGRAPFTVALPFVKRPILAERLAWSGTAHAGIMAALIVIATSNLTPRAAALKPDDRPPEAMRLVFMMKPGPGGGGGGGGLQQRPKPPKALRQGTHAMSSPIPVRREPKPIEPTPAPPEPKPEPPLKSEQLPVVVAPIIAAPADNRDRIGVLEQTTAQTDSHGPGKGGGAGTGTGTGVGEGESARDRRRRRPRDRRAARWIGRRREDSARLAVGLERSRGAGGATMALRAGDTTRCTR